MLTSLDKAQSSVLILDLLVLTFKLAVNFEAVLELTLKKIELVLNERVLLR